MESTLCSNQNFIHISTFCFLLSYFAHFTLTTFWPSTMCVPMALHHSNTFFNKVGPSSIWHKALHITFSWEYMYGAAVLRAPEVSQHFARLYRNKVASVHRASCGCIWIVLGTAVHRASLNILNDDYIWWLGGCCSQSLSKQFASIFMFMGPLFIGLPKIF